LSKSKVESLKVDSKFHKFYIYLINQRIFIHFQFIILFHTIFFIFFNKTQGTFVQNQSGIIKVETKFHKFLYLFNKSKDINPLLIDYNIHNNFYIFFIKPKEFCPNSKSGIIKRETKFHKFYIYLINQRILIHFSIDYNIPYNFLYF